MKMYPATKKNLLRCHFFTPSTETLEILKKLANTTSIAVRAFFMIVHRLYLPKIVPLHDNIVCNNNN